MTNGDQPAVTSVSALLAVWSMKTALLASARRRSLIKEKSEKKIFCLVPKTDMDRNGRTNCTHLLIGFVIAYSYDIISIRSVAFFLEELAVKEP